MNCLLALTNCNPIFIIDVEVTYKEYTGHRSKGDCTIMRICRLYTEM
jgi:hypothetical protein